jgi:hypothetical protein
MTTKAAPRCCPSCAANASELADLRDQMDTLGGQVEAFQRSVLRLDESTGEAMAAAASARRARTKRLSGIGITPISPVSNVVPLRGRSA